MTSAQSEERGVPAVDPKVVDPKVVEAVQMVRDRFGAHGLRDMLRLGQDALAEAEHALAQLRDEVSES